MIQANSATKAQLIEIVNAAQELHSACYPTLGRSEEYIESRAQRLVDLVRAHVMTRDEVIEQMRTVQRSIEQQRDDARAERDAARREIQTLVDELRESRIQIELLETPGHP